VILSCYRTDYTSGFSQKNLACGAIFFISFACGAIFSSRNLACGEFSFIIFFCYMPDFYETKCFVIFKNENSWGSTLTHSDHEGERATSGLRIGFQYHFHVILFVSGRNDSPVLVSLCAASRMWVRHRLVVIVPRESGLEFSAGLTKKIVFDSCHV